MGLEKGNHIALVAVNSPHYIIGLYTASEMTYILKNGDVKAIITMDVLMERFVAIGNQLQIVEYYIVAETGAEVGKNCPK